MIKIADKVEILNKHKDGEEVVRIDERHLLSRGDLTRALVIRDGGDFEGTAFYLNDRYNWVIGEDDQGLDVLIPSWKE